MGKFWYSEYFMNKTYFVIGIVVLIVIIGGFSMAAKKSKSTKKSAVVSEKTASPSGLLIDTSKQYSAILKTSMGDIAIALNASATPVTVNNFVKLSQKKFYDQTVFHRVIKGFMIQGGDPEGTGRGGPGYKFDDEAFEGKYTRGTVAMANSGPNTNGSQFFIMHKDTPLPHAYVIFGKVTDGMDVVDKIAESPVDPYGEGSTPEDPVVVKSVTIETK